MKAVLLFVLFNLFFHVTFAQTPVSMNGKPVAEEERSIIEKIYEEKVKEAVSTVVARDKFSVSVSVVIKAEEQKIKDYYEEEEMNTLPGVPIEKKHTPKSNNNSLLSMVTNVNVVVVVDKTVEKAQTDVIEKIITNKLKLDREKGDSISIEKVSLATEAARNPSFEEEAEPVSKLDKIPLPYIVAMVVLSLLILLALWQITIVKAELKVKPKISADLKVDTKSDTTTQGHVGSSTEGQPETDAISAADQKEEPVRKKKYIKPVRTVSEYREKILSMAVNNPKSISKVMRKMVDAPEGMKKLAIIVEEIGIDYAMKIFTGVTKDQWKKIGSFIKDNVDAIDTSATLDIMAEAYRKMVGETVGMGSEGYPATPFDFLATLGKPDLKQLMDSESISNIALIAAHFESEQMADIIAILPEEKQKQIILEIARFDNLPKDAVQKAANELSERLKTLYDPNKLVVQGGEYIANYLNCVDSSKEETFLTYLEQQDPGVRDRLRKFYFSFDDIALVSEKYISAALEDFDSTTIAKSLINCKKEVYNIVLRSLPPKKSMIVSDEVGALAESTGGKEVLEYRKTILSSIKKTLKNFGIEPSDLLKNSQKKDEGQGNASAA